MQTVQSIVQSVQSIVKTMKLTFFNLYNSIFIIIFVLLKRESMDKQHVQLPNNMTSILTPQDLLVYISIKRYMNKDTKEAFPSLMTIANNCGASIPTVRKCIRKLEDGNYIKIIKKGRVQIYKFIKYTNFEPFSYEFLDRQDLTFTEKSYIVASQQYMIKDNGIGKISMNNKELAVIINMSESTISRCNNSLINKGYLDILKAKQATSGITINEKFFKLDELGQAIVFTLQDHEDRINKNSEEIEELKKELKIAINNNKEMKQQINELTKTITL